MRLSHADGFGGRREVMAEVSRGTAASSYGMPAIVLDDGDPLDAVSWIVLDYRVAEATPEEWEALRGALSPYGISPA